MTPPRDRRVLSARPSTMTSPLSQSIGKKTAAARNFINPPKAFRFPLGGTCLGVGLLLVAKPACLTHPPVLQLTPDPSELTPWVQKNSIISAEAVEGVL